MRRYTAWLVALMFYGSILSWNVNAENFNISAHNVTSDNGSITGFKSITGDSTGNVSGFDNATFTGRTTTADFITKGPYVDVRAFAPVGTLRDGTVDWTSYIQAAIDNALQSYITVVYIPDGNYKITGPLHLGYGQTYVSIRLVGAGVRMDATGSDAGTIINATHSNAPAIVIQGGRNISVENMSIFGVSANYARDTYYPAINAKSVSYDNISTATNWVNGITANGLTRYAPYAGIAIDPYSGTAPGTAYPTVTYPSWTGIGTTQYGKLSSSDTSIKNVTINGFYVGVAQTPSDSDANGDFLKYFGGYISNCSYAVSVGNTQSRNVTIHDVTFDRIHTFITNNVNGKQNGTLDLLMTDCSGGEMFQLFSFSSTSSTGPVNFKNVYCEIFVRLGNSGTSNSTLSGIYFDSCLFLYSGWNASSTYIYNVPMYVGAAPLYFNSSFFDALTDFSLFGGTATGSVTLINSHWSTRGYDNTIMSDNNYKLAYNYLTGGMAFLGPSSQLNGTSRTANATPIPSPNPESTQLLSDTVEGRYQIHQFAKYAKYSYGPKVLLQNTGNYSSYPVSAISAAFDNSTLAFTFLHDGAYQSRNRDRIEPGCILYHTGANALFVVDNVAANASDWDVSATMVTNYYYNAANDKVVIDAVSTSSGSMYAYQTFHKGQSYQYRGNTTAGSDNVTSVTRPDGNTSTVTTDFQVGDLVWNNDLFWDNRLPAATKVIATGAGWIQLDTVATDNATAVAIELYR